MVHKAMKLGKSILIVGLFWQWSIAGDLYIATPVAVDKITTNTSKTLTVNDGASLDIGSGGVINNGIIVAEDTISCEGNWVNSTGLFDRNFSTIIMDGTGLQSVTGSVAFHNFRIANSYAGADFDNNDVDSESMTLTGQLLVDDGQFQPATNTVFADVRININGILKPDAGAYLRVKGNWINNGTFSHNSGTISFDSTGQSIAGNSSFFNLQKTTTVPDTLTFAVGATQTIENSLTLTGTSENLLALRSDAIGQQFSLSVSSGGNQSLEYLDVKDADASAGELLTAYKSVDSGNNTNWEILADVIVAQIKLWLEATYDVSGDSMSTSLNSLLPTTSPYYNDDVTTESVTADAVDWVAVELRSSATGATVDSVSMFLTADGNVQMVNGATQVQFVNPIAGDYYVVVRHRNHLPIMSKDKETFKPNGSEEITMIDLTDVANIYGDGSGIKLLETAVYGMISGETNESNIITNSDKDAVIEEKNLSGYYKSDTNFSGIVTNSDKDAIIENKNSSSSVP